MSTLQLTATETSLDSITSIASNTYFETAYPVYLTFLTSGDYEYGGTFYFKIGSPFKWVG